MGLTVKASFSAGELDPVLHERTTLDKYRNGMATARNVVVGKTGSVISRQSRFQFNTAKLDDSVAICYSPPGSGLVIEWGHLYARLYNYSTGVLTTEIVHPFFASDIPNLHFETSGTNVYVFCSGKPTFKFQYSTGIINAAPFAQLAAPVSVTAGSAGTPTGYKVDYTFTYVQNGQESPIYTGAAVGTVNVNLPIAAGQSNFFSVFMPASAYSPVLSEMRVYRRPNGGGAYGYIGSSTTFDLLGPQPQANFVDLGQSADYTHTPPSLILTDTTSTLSATCSQTGVIYQQRLLITDALTDQEAIYASATGLQGCFNRNYPLDSASALKFKCGTSGYARVLRMLDSDGLVAFTSAGIFLNQGELSPTNLSMAKKGKWIINPSIKPLAVPGGVLFVDDSTNSVRNLLFDLQTNAFGGEEVSIYSQHLFRTRSFVSMDFQTGAFPLLWIVFNDGLFASFTFEFDQEMKAWTRHDSDDSITVESSCMTDRSDTTFFVVKKVINGVTKRYIEYTIPRYAPVAKIATDPQAELSYIAYMDSTVGFKTVLNDSLKTGDSFTLDVTQQELDENGQPIGDDWSGPLNLYTSKTGIFSVALGNATVGNIFRIFDSEGTTYDLTVLSRTDDKHIIVQPDKTFDSSIAIAPRIYLTKKTFTGLDHLEGEYPSVVSDGAVICSPNNDKDNYPAVQVVGGSLTLPDGLSGAIVLIGRPITGDVETLDIDTVEQSPTLVESISVNKLYIKVHQSSGLFVGNEFPDDNKVAGMETLDSYDVDYEEVNPIIGNRAQPAQTKRVEMTLPGSWRSQGKICIRQVDPLHFEILSIIPDVEVLKRSDR